MHTSIFSSRLQLIPLDLTQLELALRDIDFLETSLNIRIACDFVTERVQRAIRLKIEKMQKADLPQHDWLTYWLIVIREEGIGAGMLGFKGFPNEKGSTEIGYGIDPAYQGKGYMSEAVQALIDWAFAHPSCKVITASAVENPASSRLLKRLGAELVGMTDHASDWEFRKSM